MQRIGKLGGSGTDCPEQSHWHRSAGCPCRVSRGSAAVSGFTDFAHMTAGCPRGILCLRRIAAGLVMLRVVFAQAARVWRKRVSFFVCRKGRRGQHGQHHAAQQQDAKYSFFHVVFPSCFCGSGLPVPSFFWFSLFLSRKHSAVIATAAAKETTATST